MIAREIVYLTPDEISLVVDIAKAMLPFEDEIGQRCQDLYVKSKTIHKAKERPARNFKNVVRLLLTSISDGDFDNYLIRIQKRGIKFAKSKEKYENLILFFHLYEDAVSPCLQKAFPQKIDLILRTLEHLYHGIIALMSRAYFMELEKDREKFLSTLVHDLRNPLIGMIGFAKMLVEKDLSKQKGSELMRTIKNTGEKMSALIDHALVYGRLKSGKATPHIKDVNAIEVAKEAAMFLLPDIEKNALSISINRHHLKDWDYLSPVRLRGDRELMLRAVGNYLSNAVKYARTKVAVNIQKKGENIIISVKDDGHGIPPDQLSLVFEHYYVVSGGKPGTGIGLSSVKMIADLHKGRVKVKSEYGSGSIFYLILPKKQEA